MQRVLASFALIAALALAQQTQAAGSNPGPAPVSLQDNFLSQEIASVLMRPDGQAVAYIVRKADLASNKNPHTLRIVNARDANDRALITADSISDAIWSRDGRAVYARLERDRRYVIVKADGATGSAVEIASSTEKINNLAVAPNGLVVFTRSAQADAETARRRKEEGMVYEWQRDTAFDIVNRNYTSGDWEDFHVVDPATRATRLLYRMKYDGAGRQLAFVEAMQFSPDSRKIALTLLRKGSPDQGGAAFNADVVILDVDTAELTETVPGSILTEHHPAWSADSRRLLFARDSTLELYDLATKQVEALPWAVAPEPGITLVDLSYDSGRGLAYARTRKAVYSFDFKHEKVAGVPQDAGYTEDVSFDESFTRYAFVDQASERRPEVALYDAKNRAARRLTDLNPWIAERAFGKVEKIEVENSSGVESVGYLVYPVGYIPGRRYPFIIGTYGFSGKFLLTAEWHTTFPVQTLAGQGYVVLLLNRPPTGQSTANDPVKARDLEGWQMLSTFDRAVDLMVSRGIADPDRVGLYGWSHGAFIVEFLLAHSGKHYKAAALGEGGDYNPGEYSAFGMAHWPKIFVNIYGGPLSEKTAPAYLQFAPVIRADHFDAPLLMEFSGKGGYFGLEMYVPLRVLGKPAELVTYDDEPHNFVSPRARFASMARKIDWFNYWMLDKEDADLAKREQYARWHELRKERDAKRTMTSSAGPQQP